MQEKNNINREFRGKERNLGKVYNYVYISEVRKPRQQWRILRQNLVIIGVSIRGGVAVAGCRNVDLIFAWGGFAMHLVSGQGC